MSSIDFDDIMAPAYPQPETLVEGRAKFVGAEIAGPSNLMASKSQSVNEIPRSVHE